MPEPSHYDVLGLKPGATKDQVRAAYRKRRGKLHPDRAGGDNDAMARLSLAYDCLSDDDKREHYDRTGADAPLQGTEHKARDFVRTVLLQQIVSCQDSQDPVRIAEAQARGKRAEATHAIVQAQQALERVRKRSRRILCRDKDSLLGNTFEAHAQTIERAISQMQEQVEIMAKAVDILAAIKFEQENPDQPGLYVQLFTSSGS